MQILSKHPGVNKLQFAGLMWPHIQLGKGKMKPRLKAAQYLRRLWLERLVKIKFLPNPNMGGPVPPHAYYYLTDFGWEVYENQDRARRTSVKRCPEWRPRPLTYRTGTKTLRGTGG